MKKVKGIIIIAIITLSFIPILPPLEVHAQTSYQSYWSMDRPQKDIHFNSTDYNVEPPERVEGYGTDEYASVGLGVEIWKYEEQGYEGDRDGVALRTVVTANTRKGIRYVFQKNRLDEWYDPSELTDTGITGDDDGVWINIPFYVRFYGGPGAQNTSFTYTRVWVSSNGFLCFNEESTSPNPHYLPNFNKPNGVIAVYWTDLDPSGGKITYWNQSDEVFIVAWYNVLNKANGARETFEVVIENRHVGGYPASYAYARGQNVIKFLYKSVSDSAIVGVENQEGSIGTMVPMPLNGKSVQLYPDAPSPEIRELSIIASKQDINAEIAIKHHQPRGYNINWLTQQNDPLSMYDKAFMGVLTLLMTEAADTIDPLGGLSLSILLLTVELAAEAAKATWPAQYLEAKDAGYDQNTAYILASAAYKPLYREGHWPVDAWLATAIDWIFRDSDGLSHTITIQGKLVYYVDGLGNQTLYTDPVTITMTPDIGQTFETAKNVALGTHYGCLDTADRADIYSFDVPASDYVIEISMTPPGSANFDLYLYNPGGNCKESSNHGGNSTEEIKYLAKSGGDWYVNVTWSDWPGGHKLDGVYRLVINVYPAPRLTVLTKTLGGSSFNGVMIWVDSYWDYSPINGLAVLPRTHTIIAKASLQIGDYKYTFQHWENGETNNRRTLNVESNITIIAYYKKEYNPPPSGGCPYVYTWNGSGYMLDNNVLGLSEVSGGSDVEDYYRLEHSMIPYYAGSRFSVYSIMLSEFENEHSYLDQVKLLAVDHPPDVNVALTPEGQILTYTNPSPPVSAIDNYGQDWLPWLLEPDNNYYQGFPGEWLLIDFGNLDVSQTAKLVLRANLEWKKDYCIHVQTLNENGEWTDRTVLRTRYNWSTLIVDLSGYLPNPDGSLKIRLYLAGIHKIDYIGLDTSPQQNIQVYTAPPVLALHSEGGKITWKLLLNDQVYAELLPGQQIQIYFALPNTDKARTFIVYLEGHYQTTK